MKPLKPLILILFTLSSGLAQAQEFEKKVAPFTKVIVSPWIGVVLQQGETESVRIVYSRIDQESIHVDVNGHTLRLYLDGAKLIDKRMKIRENGRKTRESVYRNVGVTAYVTYKKLNKLSVRGAEDVSFQEGLTTDKKFKLTAYGESEIELPSLICSNFKATLYGTNRVKIKGGTVEHQKLKLFGENKVDIRAVESKQIITTIYGEGLVKASASQVFHLNALGEPRIQLYGNGYVSKGIILGTPNIQAGF